MTSSDKSPPELLEVTGDAEMEAVNCKNQQMADLDDFVDIHYPKVSIRQNIPVVNYKAVTSASYYLLDNYQIRTIQPPPGFGPSVSGATGSVQKRKNADQRRKAKFIFSDSSDSSDCDNDDLSEKKPIQFKDIKQHYLRQLWSLWTCNGSIWKIRSGSYFKGDLIESLNAIPEIKALTNIKIALFRSMLSPNWENPENRDCGHWKMTFLRRHGLNVYTIWCILVSAMIEEFYDSREHMICGIIFEVQDQFVYIYVQDSNASKTESNFMLKCKLVALPLVNINVEMVYESFEEISRRKHKNKKFHKYD